MDHNIILPLSSVCEGCLSVERSLTVVSDEITRKIFYDSLDGVEHPNLPLQLCWECVAVVARIRKFKLQVRTAHDCLVRCILNESTTLSTLSKLTIYTNDTYITFNADTIPPSPSSPTPLFVKIENDTQDEYYDEGDGFDDLGIQGDEKTQIKEIQSQLVPKKTKRKRKTRKKEVDFNDSDDEPLKPKAVENEGDGKEIGKERKPGGRRKKKEEVKPERKPRREKPAGVVRNARVLKKLQELNIAPDQLDMVVLSWEQVEEERQHALTQESFTCHAYKCYDCVVGFNHRCKLIDHMKKHDTSVGSEECNVCRVRCRDTHALAAHRRRHRVRWRCTTCGGQWSRATVAADHVSRAHGARPTHTCRVCGDTHTSLGKLRNHLKNHAERQKCELCDKTFRDKTSLRTHLFIHKGEKEYECDRCGKRFLFKKAMQIHLITHDASAHLYCHVCDMNFKNRMSYNQHLKYNLKHVDPDKLKYGCSICGKKFVKARRLQEHNLAVHLKLTPIACTLPQCNFACSSRAVLRTHVRMVHRNARARRDHVCHLCGGAYTTKKSLEGHLRGHSGERPFRCVHCRATFAHRAALHNHTHRLHPEAEANATTATIAINANNVDLNSGIAQSGV